jgi:hypothetical protein
MSAFVEAAGGALSVSDVYSVGIFIKGLPRSAQEYPDRMLATFSILPSPKVSETVVEVSRAKCEIKGLAC